MLTYDRLQAEPREFLALTGLTVREFRLLPGGFARVWERLYPSSQTGQTLAGRPRRRLAGGGRRGALPGPGQKLLFILVYVKAYPLQVVMGELFGLSQPAVNGWVHRLLPALRAALQDSGVRPERAPGDFARSQAASGGGSRLIVDATDRRRQRPKNPEKQALHYTGKKKAHVDKNLVITDASRGRVGFLSRTYPGRTHDKKVADAEAVSYPPGAVLYKDTGFQGYEPAVRKTCQPKKKAARGGAHRRGEADEPEVVEHPGQGGARHRRRETLPRRQGRPAEHQGGGLGFGHGSRFRTP